VLFVALVLSVALVLFVGRHGASRARTAISR
jgi:hypothetical protein